MTWVTSMPLDAVTTCCEKYSRAATDGFRTHTAPPHSDALAGEFSASDGRV